MLSEEHAFTDELLSPQENTHTHVFIIKFTTVLSEEKISKKDKKYGIRIKKYQ